MSSLRSPHGRTLRERVVHYRASKALPREQAAARISAYVYGNIIIFAAIVPMTRDDVAHGHALQLVSGVAFSTFLAHVFAELIGHNARSDDTPTRAVIRHELRDAGPIATTAFVPCLLMAAAWAGWLPGMTAIVASDVYLLLRLALVGLIVERLRSSRASARTLLAGPALAAVAAAIALLKVTVGH
ncbi:hypothetical protein [Sphaerisporangium krabiense]|uniref:Uncharacterized protein n=1 Tax=Sphaerisporangium krabiense TaxID=763782 RepID=A0A7W8Z616_9ACTN|nr:hypothetical protein [Sphaerisporangium krabiense]MBB5628061.1 hypothetical protein [Sphaerisporangium krabiense]